jgi:hypothetical protein
LSRACLDTRSVFTAIITRKLHTHKRRAKFSHHNPLLCTIAVNRRAFPIPEFIPRQQTIATQLLRVIQTNVRLLEDTPAGVDIAVGNLPASETTGKTAKTPFVCCCFVSLGFPRACLGGSDDLASNETKLTPPKNKRVAFPAPVPSIHDHHIRINVAEFSSPAG